MTLHEFFRTLWHGRFEILGAVVVVVGVSILYLARQDVTYEATAQVRLTAAETAIGGGELAEVTAPADPSQIRDETLIESVAQALGRDPAAVEDRARASVEGNTVLVFVSSGDEDDAVETANAFATVYADWLGTRQAQLIDQYTARRDRLAEELADIGTASDASDDPLVSAERDLIVSEYATLTVELRTLEAVPEPVATAVPTTGAAALGPSWRTTVLAAMLAGVLAGVGLAFGRRALDGRVRSGEDASEFVGAPVLAEIHNVHQSVRQFRWTGTLPVATRTATPFTESIRELRTAIEVAVTGVDHPVVVITASDKYESRAFITANVAASFGLSGVAVTVIAGDLRRPQLEDLLPSDVSAGSGRRRTGVPDVTVQYLPESHLDPADLLATSAVREIVETRRSGSTMTLIDAPPVLAAADATILGRYATTAVLVAAAGTTSRTVLRQATERLSTNGVPLAGIALAEVKVDRRTGYDSTYGDDSPTVSPRAALMSTVSRTRRRPSGRRAAARTTEHRRAPGPVATPDDEEISSSA